MIETITANQAAAIAARLARIEVSAVYPITPQTSISEAIADMIARGEMDAKYLLMKRALRHVALIGASYIGARTSPPPPLGPPSCMRSLCGLRSRRPIASVAARTIGGPWNIWGEHMDVIAERDVGWMQFFCESNQEVLDTVLLAYRVAEDPRVMLPAMVVEDGFILSHTVEKVDVPEQAQVDEYLPSFCPEHVVDFNEPRRFGGLVMPDWWTEFRHRIAQAMEGAKERIVEGTGVRGSSGGLEAWWRIIAPRMQRQCW